MLKKLRKDKRKQNINSRKYGQVKLRHAKRGVGSCLFAIGALCALAIFLSIAYTTYGEADKWIGSMGLITFISPIMGIVTGVNGFREREKNYVTCKIGIVLNGIIVMMYVLLFIRGLF